MTQPFFPDPTPIEYGGPESSELLAYRYYDAERLHDIDDELRWGAFGRDGTPGDIVIHFDPCRPRHCRHCMVEECPVRSAQPEAPRPFSVEECTRDDEILETGLPVRAPR